MSTSNRRSMTTQQVLPKGEFGGEIAHAKVARLFGLAQGGQGCRLDLNLLQQGLGMLLNMQLIQGMGSWTEYLVANQTDKSGVLVREVLVNRLIAQIGNVDV